MTSSKCRYQLTIDGALIESEHTFPVCNPADGIPFADAPECSDENLEHAIQGAVRTYRASWKSDEAARIDALTRAADVLDANASSLASLVTREQGKPIREARSEVGGAARTLRYYASVGNTVETIQDNPVAVVQVSRQPIGVVAAITPWNSPIVTAVKKIAPALRAGNTVVLKPSPFTPLSSLLMGELFKDIFPPGALNVISGQGPLGANLVAHEDVRCVSLTGSVSTGQKVAQVAGSSLKRMILELGGNDAAIVLEGAVVGDIADRIWSGAFGNAGQTCVAIKRLYVHESQCKELVDALVARTRIAVIGNGLDDATDIGPCTTLSQRDYLSDLVADAVAQGAQIVAGGHMIDRPGYFYAPTILVGCNSKMRIVAEEQFGPVLPVITYGSVDEAIDDANSTPYGLGASVWASDADSAVVLANSLEAGTVWINGHRSLGGHQPFGGVKSSGIGVQGGVLGLEAFTDVRVLWRAGGG